MLKKSLLIISLAVGASLAAGSLLAPTPAFAQQAKVSKKVGDPLAAALDAGKKGQYAQALAKLKAADAVPGKTAFEQFKINEAFGFIYNQQRNYAAAAAAYERSLNSGELPAGQVNERLKTLAQLNFQSPRNLNKVVEYSNRYLKATGGGDAAMHAMLGQAYQLMGNDKAAVASVQSAVRLSGGRPAENWLRILLKSYGSLGNTKGVTETTEKLVSLYPTPDNWRLLSSELRKQARGDDRTAMNVYRLMGALDLMDKPEIYMEAAVVALDLHLPAEAMKIMEQGYARKVFGPKDEAGSQRRLTDARKKTAAQQLTLAQIAQSAAASKAGQDEVMVGEVLLSYGQADKAVAAGKRALQKGANPDDAWMLVGRSQVHLKNGVEARKAFSQVKGAEAAPVAKLWGIYASRI
jgi:tetratricopeptide (TPR) repeat protein